MGLRKTIAGNREAPWFLLCILQVVNKDELIRGGTKAKSRTLKGSTGRGPTEAEAPVVGALSGSNVGIGIVVLLNGEPASSDGREKETA